jgi:myo-inositol-1(or 4)-monophosphatase
MTPRWKDIEQLAIEAFDQMPENRDWHLKDHNQLVTECDLFIENFLIEGLGKLIPEAGFITEENQIQQNANTQWVWVIDPIDGTTNFAHGLPMYCCSIALLEYGQPVLGLIHLPVLKETFAAKKGEGAFLNGKPIQMSKAENLESSLIATGFPYHSFVKTPEYLRSFESFMPSTQGIRRMGSAAIDLAYTANGRFDGFFEYGLSIWDVAAGILIVEEAGGVVSNFRGETGFIDGVEVLAANPSVHPFMLKVIQESAGID